MVLRVAGPLLARGVDVLLPFAAALGKGIGMACVRLVKWLTPAARRVWKWTARARGRLVAWTIWLIDRVLQFGGLNARESAVLQEALGGAPVGTLWRTRTRVDVGMWFRKGRVWACPLGHELLLVAEGERPWTQRIAYSQIRESRYNHVTAEVVFAPEEDLEVPTLRVRPLEGLELMGKFGS